MTGSADATFPRLLAAVPQFLVTDVVSTAEYYRDVFGFQIDGYFGDPPVFALVVRDAVQFFFSKGDISSTRTNRNGSAVAYDAYVHVRDVDGFAAELKRRGATVLEGPVDRVYNQREVVVRDCNGFVLAFGEDGDRAKSAKRPTFH